jgi:signal recognition particle subunit SEC65
VLTNNSYKKNVAYDLLRKLSKSIYEANPSLQDRHATVSDLDIKEVVESMCRDYQNPRNLDKVGMAQMQVDKARSVMQRNVEGMVKNIQDAEVTISVVKVILIGLGI